MAGSIRIFLMADGFFDDVELCITEIKKFTDTPISVFASGKENREAETRFGAKWQKNKLGWGNAVTSFLTEALEDYVVVMDPSTIFLGDSITPARELLESGWQGVGWRGGLINVDDDWRSVLDRGPGEVDVLFSYFMALDRKFALDAGGANPSATYYRNADLELSLAVRAAGGRLAQIELPLRQERHHGYHDVDPDYRERKSKENYNRILERFRGKSDILSPRR